MDKIINPDEWTMEELVKHLYRDMQDVKHNQSVMMSKVEKLELEQIKRRIQVRTVAAVAAGAGAFLGWLFDLVVKLFKWRKTSF